MCGGQNLRGNVRACENLSFPFFVVTDLSPPSTFLAEGGSVGGRGSFLPGMRGFMRGFFLRKVFGWDFVSTGFPPS